MLWVQRKGSLSLFSTNTDGCCFEWGLVLLKHDKVRDDMPLVTKVWRSRNASAVAFFFLFRQDNLLFMYYLPIKGKCCQGMFVVCFLSVNAETEKWENEQNFRTSYTERADRGYFLFSHLWKLNDTWKRAVTPLWGGQESSAFHQMHTTHAQQTVLLNATKTTK